MICDKCHLSEASVVVNHVINGHTSIFHFCERCAEDQGLLGIGRLLFKIPMPNFGLVVPSNLYREAKGLGEDTTLDCEFEELIQGPLLLKEGAGESYLEQKINELKKERDKAIKNEEYRSAAMLRDRIKELKKELN
ncbi:UvrB/UvrC motif-containing protein [Patescibacteria group bacterium]|nr:UvrB/UvrC motif-containing protein [Patescibacteria group bacterium]